MVDNSYPLNATRNALVVVVLIATCLVGFFSWPLWNPATQKSIQKQVESFERAQFHTASWDTWSIAAGWLRESNVILDLSKPRQLLQQEIEGEQNPFVLGVAFETGLIASDDLPRLRKVSVSKERLLNGDSSQFAISSIRQEYYVIAALEALGQLSASDRDVLESRLLKTLREALTSEFLDLSELLAATKALEAIDRVCRDDSIKADVLRTLVDAQRLQFQLGSRTGGFAPGPKYGHADLLAAAVAVQLMQRFGIPPELEIMPLRSFLKTSFYESFSTTGPAAARAATRFRLEQFPEIPPVTGWDYVRYESNLWMTLMLVLLCFVATFGCPNRSLRPLLGLPSQDT